MLTAAYKLNWVHLKSVSYTSYELSTGKKPDLSHLRPWGSVVYVHNSIHMSGKLGAKSKNCIFIRYSELFKGYVFIGEYESGIVIELESWDVNFIENEFPSIGEIDEDFQIYELEYPNKVITSNVGVGTSANPVNIYVPIMLILMITNKIKND